MNASDLAELAAHLSPIDPVPPIAAEVAFVGRLQVAELLLARCLEDAKALGFGSEVRGSLTDAKALGYGSQVTGSITDAKASTRYAWRCVAGEV